MHSDYTTPQTCGAAAANTYVYSSADVASCYCQQAITDLVREFGTVKGAYYALTQSAPVCAVMTRWVAKYVSD